VEIYRKNTKNEGVSKNISRKIWREREKAVPLHPLLISTLVPSSIG
jgi:hypothetical protein